MKKTPFVLLVNVNQMTVLKQKQMALELQAVVAKYTRNLPHLKEDKQQHETSLHF